MRKIAFILVAVLLLCTENLRAEVYTIDFNKGTMNGRSSSYNSLPSDNPAAFCAEGAEYIAAYSESSCFYRSTGCGIRIGKLNGTGQANIILTFSEQIQSQGIVKIVAYASRGTDNADADLSFYAGTNTTASTVSFADMKDYDASFPESENYILPEIIVEKKFKMLKIVARSTNFVMLHRIDIYTADEASIALPMQSGGTCYAPFSSDKATFFGEDVTAFKVSVIDGQLVLSETEMVECFDQSGCKVPANTGVLLASASSSVTYYVLDGETLNPFTDNMLRAASDPMEGNFSFYRLAYKDTASETGLGFYWGAEDGGAFTCEAGSAYLTLPAGSNAEGFSLADATYEDATLLPRIFTDEMGIFYNLAGQRISKPSPGKMYIHGGRKVIVK